MPRQRAGPRPAHQPSRRAQCTCGRSGAGTDADYFILSFAEELNATVVSNDRFKDRIKQYPALRKRLIKYMIVQGEVVFEERTGRRE